MRFHLIATAFFAHKNKIRCDMKSSFKSNDNGTGAKASHDAFPQNLKITRNVQDNGDNYWQLPSDSLDPSPEFIATAEEDFRCFIKSRIPQQKAPSRLLKRIKLSIHQPEE
jgi:hypothetical protein